MASNNHFSRGATYEKLVGGTSTRLAAAALSYLPFSTYTSSTRILDSACGPGIVTKLLLSPTPHDVSVPGLPLSPPPRVTGIDLLPPMIDQYNQNIAMLGWSTADAYVQDSADLSRFGDGEFDAVVMSLGIFALKDTAAVVAEIHRVLKPGGHAVVTTWKTRRPQSIFQNAVEAMRSPLWTASIWEGWSEGEKGQWRGEVTRQLSEQEKATATIEMVGWICIAQKEA
ncbi:Uu.00g127590.m01.CDS01 [Anthostomella pinea]|uniref:Uu.00g127590.m01.CDS01 n=1 Tax=Anthostomella pinea TaxID=933095 RepID=A0AAI8VJ38_9PEZI|nr:Uu.00g127590.m01.CDS01 [Anthostomella pinea]